MSTTVTRTVTSGLRGNNYFGTHVSINCVHVIPEYITRFSTGTKVEVRKVDDETFAVQAISENPLRIFGEEMWKVSV